MPAIVIDSLHESSESGRVIVTDVEFSPDTAVRAPCGGEVGSLS